MSGLVTIVEALTAAVQCSIKLTDTQTSQLVTSPVFTKETKETKTSVEGVKVYTFF